MHLRFLSQCGRRVDELTGVVINISDRCAIASGLSGGRLVSASAGLHGCGCGIKQDGTRFSLFYQPRVENLFKATAARLRAFRASSYGLSPSWIVCCTSDFPDFRSHGHIHWNSLVRDRVSHFSIVDILSPQKPAFAAHAEDSKRLGLAWTRRPAGL